MTDEKKVKVLTDEDIKFFEDYWNRHSDAADHSGHKPREKK